MLLAMIYSFVRLLLDVFLVRGLPEMSLQFEVLPSRASADPGWRKLSGCDFRITNGLGAPTEHDGGSSREPPNRLSSR